MDEQYCALKTDKAGLSRTDLLLAVTFVVLVLGLLIAFVLIAFSAWGEGDDFTACSSRRASSPACEGTSIVSTRPKSAGDRSSAEVDETIDDIMQKDADEEQGGDSAA